jgi:formylglycine-generating enzyme required for sulfatase activity
MRILAIISLLLISLTGCGGSAGPNLADVTNRMTPEQLEIGPPLINSADLILVPIPAGQFQMGNPAKKGARGGPDSPRHGVKISQPFYMSICEVTQKQYEQVMGERPWAGKPLVQEGPNNAASYISWEKATEFCAKLSEQEKTKYRLPTEAEWEYACRAQTATTWNCGDEYGDLTDYAWFDANAYKTGEQYAHPVGKKLPNYWGLFDMHGNTWEWCQDFYGRYDGQQITVTDPKGPDRGRVRVWRGGSFASAAANTRSTSRISYGRVDYRAEYLAGFRVVKSIEAAN